MTLLFPRFFSDCDKISLYKGFSAMMIKTNILHVPFVFLDRNVINVCISAVCSDHF